MCAKRIFITQADDITVLRGLIALTLEIREHCPQAEVVFDLFHVVAEYGREVTDRVRVDQANRLRHDRPARRVLKSTRCCAAGKT